MNKKKWFRRLLDSGGMSMAETLIAVCLIALLSLCIATGTAFGAYQYQKSLLNSEARVLSSTLTSLLQEELGNTRTVQFEDGVLSYFSPRYTPHSADPNNNLSKFVMLDEEGKPAADGFGQLALSAPQLEGGAKFIQPLHSSAYAKSQKLKVKVTVTPEPATSGEYIHCFNVKLEFEVAEKRMTDLDTEFLVFPLNRVKLNADAGSP